VIDNLSNGRLENVPPSVHFMHLDIKSQGAFDFVCGWLPQVIVHLAAQMSVQTSVSDPVGDARENILGSLNLLQAAARSGVEKVIFSSTGGAISGDEAPVPARETDPVQPESPYDIAKMAVEHYLRFFSRQYRIIPISLRYANVYGPRQNGLGEAGVVAILIEKFLAGHQAVINGNGLQTRDFVYVADVVAANLLALTYPSAGVFNIGTGQETDIRTIARKLQDLTGSPINPTHGPAKPGEQRRSALNSRLAEDELRWRPRVSLDEGLGRTVVSFRERQ
jgi:UDP-glucose 4-epimerase